MDRPADVDGGSSDQRDRSLRVTLRSVLRNGATVLGVLLLALLALVALFVIAPPYGWFGDDTWRARVVSVDGREVCTTPDVGEEDPGWSDPFCLDDEMQPLEGAEVQVEVGDCIEIESRHPVFFVKGVVECTPPG